MLFAGSKGALPTSMQMARWISWNSPLQFISYARSCRVWPFPKCCRPVWRPIQESLDRSPLHQFNKHHSNNRLLLLLLVRPLQLQKPLLHHRLPKTHHQRLFVLLHSVRCCVLIWLLLCDRSAFSVLILLIGWQEGRPACKCSAQLPKVYFWGPA